MVYLSLQQQQKDAYVGVLEISEAIDSPKSFTAKILQQLSKASLLESQPGPKGGFYLAKDSKVSLAEIIQVIDGNRLLEGCILGFKECTEVRPCPIHIKYKQIRSYLKETLVSTHIEELKKVIKNEKAFLKF